MSPLAHRCLARGLVLALLTSQEARAKPATSLLRPPVGDAQIEGGERSRIYAYRDDEVFAVVTSPGRITDIVLEVGETLVETGAVAAGDTVRWVIGDTVSGSGASQRPHVLVKPTLAGLATNLVLNTTRRTYHVDLRSVARGGMAQVAWRYPPAIAPVSPPPPPPLVVAPPAPDPAKLNFAYKIKGPRVAWRPCRVFDDGAKTYVEFAPGVVMTDLPPLFVVGADGKTSELINYRVVGVRIVVDRILDRAELRMGQGRGERRVRLMREAVR